MLNKDELIREVTKKLATKEDWNPVSLAIDLETNPVQVRDCGVQISENIESDWPLIEIGVIFDDIYNRIDDKVSHGVMRLALTPQQCCDLAKRLIVEARWVTDPAEWNCARAGIFDVSFGPLGPNDNSQPFQG